MNLATETQRHRDRSWKEKASSGLSYALRVSVPLWQLRHHQFSLTQIFNSIAQLGGFFKLKFLSVLAHLEFQARDRFFNLLRAVIGDVIQFHRHFEVISFRRG